MPRKVWAAYWQTRRGDQGIELYATEKDAWLAMGEMVDVSDYTEDEAANFWTLLDHDVAAFRSEFYELLGPTGNDVLVEEVTVPEAAV